MFHAAPSCASTVRCATVSCADVTVLGRDERSRLLRGRERTPWRDHDEGRRSRLPSTRTGPSSLLRKRTEARMEAVFRHMHPRKCWSLFVRVLELGGGPVAGTGHAVRHLYMPFISPMSLCPVNWPGGGARGARLRPRRASRRVFMCPRRAPSAAVAGARAGGGERSPSRAAPSRPRRWGARRRRRRSARRRRCSGRRPPRRRRRRLRHRCGSPPRRYRGPHLPVRRRVGVLSALSLRRSPNSATSSPTHAMREPRATA